MRHLEDVAANRLGLAALLGVNAGVGTRCVDKGEHRQLEFFSGFHQAQRLAVTLGLAHAEIAQPALLGVAAFLLANHHTGCAVKSRQTTNDAEVVRKMAVTVQLHKMGEQFVHIVHGVRALGVAGNLGDLPGRQITVDVFGKLLAFFGQLVDFSRDVYRGLGLHIAQFFNLVFQLGNWSLEIKEIFLSQNGLLISWVQGERSDPQGQRPTSDNQLGSELKI